MEEPLFTLRPSLKPIKVWYIVGSVLFLLYLPALITGKSLTLILLSPGFYILLIAGLKHLQRNNVQYTLTSEKLTIRSGILGKSENNVPLSKIQNVASAFSLTQRIYGIGNIIIESAGGRIGDIPLRNIEKPDQYVDKILEAVHKKERAHLMTVGSSV